jgi:hypothetical protein
MQGFNNTPAFGQQIADNLVGGNFSGILSTRAQAKYASGARTILRINGKPAVFAFGVSWNIMTSYREVNGIDNPLPEELVPQRIRVEGSITALHIPGWGAADQKWQADSLGFLFHRYITIEVRDSATDELLFFAPKAAITSRREEIKVDALAHVSLSFIAIGYRDEKDPSIPTEVDKLKNTINDVEKWGDSVASELTDVDSVKTEKRLAEAVASVTPG